jgi:hypothetical protein
MYGAPTASSAAEAGEVVRSTGAASQRRDVVVALLGAVEFEKVPVALEGTGTEVSIRMIIPSVTEEEDAGAVEAEKSAAEVPEGSEEGRELGVLLGLLLLARSAGRKMEGAVSSVGSTGGSASFVALSVGTHRRRRRPRPS